MNERIKEILSDYDCVPAIKELEVYIKRLLEIKEQLQQENERLKVNCNIGYEELKVARNYKSRCKKAIEYIENNKKETSSHFNGKEYVYRNFTLCCEPNDLLNILNEGDENE